MLYLEKVKPEGWIVEVSTMEDAQHMDCMKPLVHILVHRSDEDPTPGNIGITYRDCNSYKTGVRVL
jgi:hypothetical protein